jgi:hypothetical protein
MGNSVRHYLDYSYGLIQGHALSRPQYSAVSVREAKYTRLEYMIRISMLYTLDPQFRISFFRGAAIQQHWTQVRK